MLICQQAILGSSTSNSSGANGSGSGRCTMTVRASSLLVGHSHSSAAAVSPDKAVLFDKGVSAMSNLSLAMLNHKDAKEGSNSSTASSSSSSDSSQDVMMMMMEDDPLINTNKSCQSTFQEEEEKEEEEEDLITILPRSNSWTARAAFHEPPPPLPSKEQIHLVDHIEQEEDAEGCSSSQQKGDLEVSSVIEGGNYASSSMLLQHVQEHESLLLLDTLQKSPFSDHDAEDAVVEGATTIKNDGTTSLWDNNGHLDIGNVWHEKVSEIHERCVMEGKPRLRMFDANNYDEMLEEDEEDGWVNDRYVGISGGSGGNQEGIGHNVTNAAGVAHDKQLAEFRSFLGALQCV